MDHKTQVKAQMAVGRAVSSARRGESADDCISVLTDRLSKIDTLTSDEMSNLIRLAMVRISKETNK